MAFTPYTAAENGHSYNNPTGQDSDVWGAQAKSDIDNYSGSESDQVRFDYLVKKALVDARRKQIFMQTADVTSMPKHHGKTMKRYFYVPLLDDRNLSSEGLGNNTLVSAEAAEGVEGSGALYQGSKDVGTIVGKMPVLGEHSGRVNRVGFTRELREGSIKKYGIFTEYTQDALDFDTDMELYDHMYREMMNGASELSEDLLQIDLITQATVVVRPGSVSTDAEIVQPVEYTDLLRLAITLDDNRTPRQSTIITGTRNVDTRVVAGVRYMYIGSELIPTLKRMTDLHGVPAFIPVEQYAAGAPLAMNEIGAIDQFRFIVHPEMMSWAGDGGADTAAVEPVSYGGDGLAGSGSGLYLNDGAGNLNLYPMLVIGDEAYSTIGFQTDGKTVKFSIISKKPGVATADSYNDPYGERGFVSLKFWYGFLLQRPERLALIRTVAYI